LISTKEQAEMTKEEGQEEGKNSLEIHERMKTRKRDGDSSI